MTNRRGVTLTIGCLAVLVAGCSVSVDERRSGDRAEVDIRTPLGDIAVRADADRPPDTGLPVYPGARPLREAGSEHDSATVSIGTTFFGMNVAAAQFVSDAAPAVIVDFYRDRMAAYGAVTECRGDIDWRRGVAVCRKKLLGRGDWQLVAGSQDRHRVVAVKPRGTGTEFAMVYIRTSRAS